jgi:hypothetical protein
VGEHPQARVNEAHSRALLEMVEANKNLLKMIERLSERVDRLEGLESGAIVKLPRNGG